MGSLQLCTSVGSVLYQTCLSYRLPHVWPWPPPPLLTPAIWSVPLPSSMPTLTGQECPPLTLPPPVLAAVLPSITASVALMLRLMLSQDTWPMDMAIPVLMVMVSMLMVSMLMVLVLQDIPVPPPPLLPDLPRDLASVVLMLNLVMDFVDMDSMEFLLVFLTMELFTESTSFTQLDTPSNMLPVASVVLMPMLMLTMVVMDMVVMDMVVMDMLAMDMLTLDMVTMDMDMAMDMDIMVNQIKLLYHHFEI